MEEMDDDFGDLYDDVEVQASAAINGVPDFTRLYIEPEKSENKDRNSTKNPNPYAGNYAPKSVALTRSGEDGTAKKVLGSEANGEKDLEVSNDSDSEDDLNIVLNDKDCKLFSGMGGASVKNGGVVGEGGCEEVEYGDENFVVVMEGTGLSKNQKRGDQLGYRLESNSNGHVSSERANGLKGNYNSQYKHKRQKFPCKMKANGYAGMTSFSSMLARGHWDDGCNQHKGSRSGQVAHIHATSSSLKAPSGYGFSLPRYRTILDVNIDTFEEKPWRYDGVDVTDFFNFGFNEDSWKRYCNSLEQFRQQISMQTRTPVYESLKLDLAYEARSEHEKLVQEDTTEEITQVGFRRIVSPPSKFSDRGVRQLELPRGKAIQVEGSIAERQPSMDVRRPHERDSDVVIQITVQDSSEDSYGSGKEGLGCIDGNVHEASENGDLNAEDNKDIHSPGSASGDELSVESLEGNVRRLERPSVLKRCALSMNSSNPKSLDSANHGNDQISDVDEHHHQKVNAHTSRRIAEAMEPLNNAEEGVCRNTCSADPCIMETEFSPGNRSQHSPTSSHSRSDSEASRDSVNVVPEEVHNPLRKSSLNSGTELQESVTLDHYLSKSSKGNDIKARLGDSKDTSRNKRPIRDEQKHCKRRFPIIAELKRHTDNHHDEASPMSDTEGSYDREPSSVDCRRRKERSHDFGYYDRENFSSNGGTEISFCLGGDRFADNHTWTGYRKYPRRKGYQNLRDEMDPYIRENWDEREFCCEQRSARLDNKDLDRDLYHYGKGLSTKDIRRFPYRESRQLVSKYSSYTAIERDTRWRRRSEDFQCRKTTNNDGCLLNYKHEDDFMPEKFGRSVSFTDREWGFLDQKHERRLPHIGREVKISGRRNRYGDNPPLDLDGSWSMEIEDEYWRHTDYRSLSFQSYGANGGRLNDMSPRNDLHDSRFSERYWRHRRQMCVEQGRDGGWFGSYNDADDAKDCIIYPDDQVHLGRRYSDRSKVPHWTEDTLLLRHQGREVFAGEASCSYEKTSRHDRTCAKHGSARGGKLTDDMQLEQQKHQMMRERNSSNCISRSPNINTSDKHEQTLLRCRDSVNLVVGGGKSSGRCSKGGSFMRNGRFENMDMKIVKEQANSKDFNESQSGKSVQPDIPEVESNPNNVKWLDKFPVRKHNENLDLEEGQIVAEEPKEELVEKKQVSEGAALTHNEKRISHTENASNGSKVLGGYDKQRILETLAKMEKRRERFKESVTLKNEPEKCPKPQVDLIVDTAEIKQQRPARKRQWGGS